MNKIHRFYSFLITWKLMNICRLRIQNKIQLITSNESDKRVNSTWLMITLIEYYSTHIIHIVSTHFCRYSTHSYSKKYDQNQNLNYLQISSFFITFSLHNRQKIRTTDFAENCDQLLLSHRNDKWRFSICCNSYWDRVRIWSIKKNFIWVLIYAFIIFR